MKDNIPNSEKDLKNTKDIQSTNNGIFKSIIFKSSEAVGKAGFAVVGCGAVSLPGGVLPGGVLTVAALSIFKQSTTSKSKETQNSDEVDNQTSYN